MAPTDFPPLFVPTLFLILSFFYVFLARTDGFLSFLDFAWALPIRRLNLVGPQVLYRGFIGLSVPLGAVVPSSPYSLTRYEESPPLNVLPVP